MRVSTLFDAVIEETGGDFHEETPTEVRVKLANGRELHLGSMTAVRSEERVVPEDPDDPENDEMTTERTVIFVIG